MFCCPRGLLSGTFIKSGDLYKLLRISPNFTYYNFSELSISPFMYLFIFASIKTMDKKNILPLNNTLYIKVNIQMVRHSGQFYNSWFYLITSSWIHFNIYNTHYLHSQTYIYLYKTIVMAEDGQKNCV